MVNISDNYIEEFITAANRMVDHGLVLCGSGNLSWRVDNERMLISVTGAWMSEMSKDKIAICSIADGASLNGKEPSIEIGFHSAILRERKDVNVVLHFQSLYATTLACSETPERNFFVIPEIPYYIGPVKVLPYMNPGSNDLTQAVTSAIRGHDLVVLRNHGQVTVGRDFREAFQRADFFEFASGILLRAGDHVQTLSEEAVAFLYRAREKGSQQSSFI